MHSTTHEPNLAAAGQLQKAWLTVDEWCWITGLGRTTSYALIKEGKLPTTKVGRRRLIAASAVASLAEAA